ncbi:MAG: CoA-binding protein [Candidatus Heimdallarchaeota archaeon]|nr:MAG: CoA-binding protein [Candidatus Heimdallarchaeota archaeon]
MFKLTQLFWVNQHVLDFFFEPRSIAIIGASSDEKKYGRLIFNHFVVPFHGRLYPVNPRVKEIMGIRCYPSVFDLPEVPDLAVVVLPAKIAIKAVADASKRGIPALVVITAGFSEVGRDDLQKELVEALGDSRLVGPNCIGIIDTHSQVNTLFPNFELPDLGHVSLISQSGSLAIDLLLALQQNKIGLRRFVSYGNGADLNETDFIQFFGQDHETKVIGAYLENVKAGRKFIKVSKAVARKKPILALKLPMTEEVTMAAKSHTGAVASTMGLYKEILRQAGIIQCDSTSQFINSIKALYNQPPAFGNQIAIVGNTGGPLAMALYRMNRYDLKLGSLSAQTVTEIEKVIEKHGVQTSLSRGKADAPLAFLDLTGSATTEVIAEVTRIFLGEKSVSGIVVVPRSDAPVVSKDAPARIALIKQEFPNKPILVYNLPDITVNAEFEKYGISVFKTAEDAVDGMHALVERGRILKEYLS